MSVASRPDRPVRIQEEYEGIAGPWFDSQDDAYRVGAALGAGSEPATLAMVASVRVSAHV
jgi:hypothetical protein